MLRLYNSKSLIQNTLARSQEISLLEKPLVVCNKKFRFTISSHIQEMDAPVQDILLEPSSQNTAPALALSALFLQKRYGDVLMLAMPADHLLPVPHKLEESIETALPFALNNNIVTFGVKPTAPNTQYGYIEVAESRHQVVHAVKRFTEKPDLKTALSFVKQPTYFWNTGIFLFRVSRILRDMAAFQPEILKHCEAALESAVTDGAFCYAGKEFSLCPSISLDYGILEKTDHLYMSELQTTWTDIGNWQTLYDVHKKDPEGNVLQGNIVAKDTHDCFVHADHGLIATLGMENCFIVGTRDATLIAHKDKLHQMPELVKTLAQNHRHEAVTPRTVSRPWGSYTVIENGGNFQIKRIVVHPHQRLSLQEHQYRSEHWIILKGKATVVLGHETHTLGPNQSTFVAVGVRHQIINDEASDLELIEVQMGSYLGEDDIKRFSDIYQRDKVDA